LARHRRLSGALAGALALALAGLAPLASAQADPIVLPEVLDEEIFCTELLPQALSTERSPLRLTVRVLLDGPSKATAQAAVTAMRKAYEPLGIDVRADYRRVRFSGVDPRGLIDQAKRIYGGSRPKGVDVVYTITDKNLAAAPSGDAVAGMADCVGGIRTAVNAFAVGEVFPEPTPSAYVPGLLIHDATGKTMAHEIGHLLGAHHHYASVEGWDGARPVATLMGPSVSVIGLRFSTLEGAVVRGHLEVHASAR
jgi:hypothetical protein